MQAAKTRPARKKVAATAATKKTGAPQRPDPAFETYLALLAEIWADVHPLIGAVTLSALFSPPRGGSRPPIRA